MARPRIALLLALATLTTALPLLVANAEAEPTVKLMVLGETHGTRQATRDLVAIAAAKGATGCICTGDFIYGHWSGTPAGWRDMMRPVMGTMLPAQGNHDWPWTDWSGMFPGGQRWYAKDVNGVQMIALNTEYSLAAGSSQRAWLDAQLAERDPAALKVVFMHRPWWLPQGAIHPGDEFRSKNGVSPSEMSALMERHGVDLVVSAHEKNHQHSLVRGVHYLVAGGGGPEFTPMPYALEGAVLRLGKNVVTTLEATPSRMVLKSYTLDWAKVDEWTIDAGTTGAAATAPADVAFAPENGNEWWVQVRILGEPVRAVDARDTDGAWTPLTYRSWGAWAASFRVEPGHLVTYRATLDDGRTATSCAYGHPAGGCETAITFRNARGNAWWVEVEADATRVDARANGGAWTPLQRTDWGSWAAGMRAPSGSTVEFRADGGAASAAYAWPP